MKSTAVVVLFIALFAAVATAVSKQDTHAAPELSPQQKWLKQLVGEWDTQYKMYMQQDQPPMESDGSDSVRALGDHWILAEMESTFMDAPIGGMLSIGYNGQKEHFNATWMDTMSGHLWVYEGALNDAGDALMLRTEGPSMEGPDKTARYREVITIKDKNHRTFTSHIEQEDGTWMKILEAEYTRKK